MNEILLQLMGLAAPNRSQLAGMSGIPGMLAPGNIDLQNRPVVKNKDGSISTIRSMSVGFDGNEVLIPTVSDEGEILSDKDAIDLYKKTGRHLGIFSSPDRATDYAQSLHEDQAHMLLERLLSK